MLCREDQIILAVFIRSAACFEIASVYILDIQKSFARVLVFAFKHSKNTLYPDVYHSPRPLVFISLGYGNDLYELGDICVHFNSHTVTSFLLPTQRCGKGSASDLYACPYANDRSTKPCS